MRFVWWPSRVMAQTIGFVALMSLLLPQTALAQGYEEPGDECGEGSTPGLVIKAQNPWSAGGPRLTLTVQTSKDGVPQANVVLDTGEQRIRDFEVHRVFLRGDHDHETTVQLDHNGDHEEGLGVGIRGLATLENGEKVRLQFDLWETRGDRSNEVRIRWRPFEEEPHGEHGGETCQGGWSYNTGWIAIQKIDIHQLHLGQT